MPCDNTLIEEIHAKYGGAEQEAVQEDLAKCVTGIAYAGRLHLSSWLLALLKPEVL